LAWSLDRPDENFLEATPLEVGGVLYFTGNYANIYAVDVRSGRMLWQYDPKPTRKPRASYGYGTGSARESAIALDLNAFPMLPRTGSLVARGMLLFNDLSNAGMQSIYQYICSQARKKNLANARAGFGD
jgi:hypothetical protein